jgi:hypothetical protein
VHVPTDVMCTLALVTVQLPRAAKETRRPEEECALTRKSAAPYVLPARPPNVILCAAFRALTRSTTCRADPTDPPPGWSYVTRHVPVPLFIVKCAPVFEHAPLLPYAIGSPLLLDAETVKLCL